jgi:hypothetical protein
MASFDQYFLAYGFNGQPNQDTFAFQAIPFDDQTAIFRVGAWAIGSRAGVQGVAVSNPGDTIHVPVFGPAGVYGASVTSPGVTGWSKENDGCQGFSFTGTGVRAASFFGPAVNGLSGALTGVTGVSDFEGPTSPTWGNIAGVVGSSDPQPGVIGTSNTAAGVVGFSNNVGVYGETSNPAGDYAGVFNGNVSVSGLFDAAQVTASVKAAVVPFPDGSKRVLYCMESPDHWFEDFGVAKLVRGRALVKLDADFVKVIKRGNYKVFLTPEGDCRGLYVRRRAASFQVRELMGGKSSIAFSYRIVGRRRDIKGHRRFAKIDTRPSLPAAGRRAPRKGAPTASALRAFVARLQKEARERIPKGARRGGRPPALPKDLERPITRSQILNSLRRLQRLGAEKK